MSLTCPYCNREIREPEDCDEQDHAYEHECPECGKSFIFYVSFAKFFNAQQAPCLNGAPHDYAPILGFPEWYFKDKRRCAQCGYEIELAPAVPPSETHLHLPSEKK